MREAQQRGFTLMELMIGITIIGILTAIAIPNYTAYIQRSNRSEARNMLLEGATWMERWRTERGLYGNAPGTPLVPPAGFPFTQVPAPPAAAKYLIAAPTILPPLGIGYTITATPVAGDVCGALSVDETGRRMFTVGPGASQDVCWNR